MEVKVIGAGLAGVEASYYLANLGYKVKLYEMRPKKMTPAHKTSKFGELVCSNSLRADSVENAVGILKREMEAFGSIIIKTAREHRVEAGGALAVDREGFSQALTDIISNHPNIEVINEEVTSIDTSLPTIIATGPLTSDELSNSIIKLFHMDNFHFYDAAAPIVDASTLDYNKVYFKSRYDKGEASYINCPMNKEEFEAFYNELINAECVVPHEFESFDGSPKGDEVKVFEGCMPVEIMAKRGPQTLLFGPLKPVGLETPDGRKPYAVVQLRQDDAAKTMYNLVGFQTHLKWPEQKRVFRMIPGLENATFTKYGVMHRNSFINAPKILNATYQTKEYPNIFIVGQLSGVEGYVESAASGLVGAINMDRYLQNKPLHEFSRKTAIGSMAYYITHANPEGFEPMNANFGIMEDITIPHKKKERKALYGKIALEEIEKERAIICDR